MGPLLGGQLAGLDQVRQERRQGVAAEAVGHAAQLPADQVLASHVARKTQFGLVLAAANQLLGQESGEEFLDGGELRVAALGIEAHPAGRESSPRRAAKVPRAPGARHP